MSKIKVFHLIKSLGRGGAEMLLPETLRVHNKDDFEYSYGYFVPYKSQLVSALEEQHVSVKCFAANNPLLLLTKSFAVARYARAWGADLIHCHLPLAGVVGRAAGRLTGIPVIYTEHNKQERYHPMTRQLNLATMGWNARILAVSDNVQESILDHWSGPKERVKLLLNGVNTQRFAPHAFSKQEARQSLGLPQDVPIIGTVCVFRIQKRLHLWLKLAQQMRAQYPSVHFVIVGDGPEEERLREIVKEYKLENCVHFPGRLEEVRPWLAALDIYLMTSEFEGLPVAMLEAMSMELPIVSTKAGGIGEVIRNDQEGYLSSVEGWQSLREPLLQLLADKAVRQRIGASARKRVIAAFSIERMARELEEHYHSIL